MNAMGATAYLLDLPVTDYGRAHRLQLSAVSARHQGLLDGDLVMMLEHAPVFTLGRRGGQGNLLVPAQWLQSRDIEVVPIERGGDITYHGPGQLVVYILMDLSSKGLGVKDFVDRLETVMARTAAHWGVSARGDHSLRGAWVGHRKLGSVGITVRRGVTFHGLAFNVGIDLEPFRWINPCGLKSCEMTSMEKETGRSIAMADARAQMALQLEALFGMELTRVELDVLMSWIGDSF
jgi:lipoate-protein ligase B